MRADGISLEHAAELAWEHGYFPDVPLPTMDSGDNMHPVTGQMLLDAIERELRADAWPNEDPGYWAALEEAA